MLWQNATSVVRICGNYQLCEYVTSAMRKRDKCYARMRQVLCEYVNSVMRICDKCNAKTRQVLSEYVKSVPRKRNKCCAKMRQVLLPNQVKRTPQDCINELII